MEMQNGTKTIVYVDAENISVNYWNKILESLSEIPGTPYIRIYRRREDLCTRSWREVCERESEFRIKEIAVEGKAKKNKIDKVIISEMLSMNTDVICIVSSDHGYGNCVEECKKKGSVVYGFGSGKRLAKHCNRYFRIR